MIKERNGVFTIVYKDQVSAFTIKFFGNKIIVNKKEEEIKARKDDIKKLG